MDAVGVEAFGRMRRQAGIAVGFLNQVLRSGPLPIEPNDVSNRIAHVGDEHAIFIGSRIEELILFARFRIVGIGFGRFLLGFLRLPCGFVISQRHETVCLVPAYRLVEELALFVRIGLP